MMPLRGPRRSGKVTVHRLLTSHSHERRRGPMAETRVTCPECRTTLRLNGPVPAGKQVRCPKCHETFRPRDADDESLPVRSRDRAASRDRDRHDDDDRRDRPRGKRPKKKANKAPMIAAIVAASVLVLGGGATAAYFLTPSKKTEPVVANNTTTGGASKAPIGPPAGATVGLKVGNVAPAIDGEDIDGHKFKLSDYRGKVVVLDFWGNW